MTKTKLGITKRVILGGPGIWHATDEADDAFVAVKRCRTTGRQLQMTTPWGDELDGRRMCLHCERILGRK